MANNLEKAQARYKKYGCRKADEDEDENDEDFDPKESNHCKMVELQGKFVWVHGPALHCIL